MSIQFISLSGKPFFINVLQQFLSISINSIGSYFSVLLNPNAIPPAPAHISKYLILFNEFK